MDSRLSFYYQWNLHDKNQMCRTCREFLDNGVNRFVIRDIMLKELIHSPDLVKNLTDVCKEMGVSFSAVHGLDDNGYDLNTVSPERRPLMFEDHINAMKIASDFGCKTYPIHIGAAHYCYDHIPLETLRSLAIETLEKLLPAAEKSGIIIAIENSFERTNSAAEVVKYIKHFNNHPALGACYDTGHANCMESIPGKDDSKYEPYFPVCWWETGIIHENNALKIMRDYVVTCHIHDNDGYGDLHAMPFDGTINWHKLIPELRSCPKLFDYQTEVNINHGTNWAGKLLAPLGGYSIRRLVDTFRYLGF